MIQPGQKLTDGDCIFNGTEEQYLDLFKLSGKVQDGMTHEEEAEKCFNNYDGIIYYENYGLQYLCLSSEHSEPKEYSFPDFKQLCENTFIDE